MADYEIPKAMKNRIKVLMQVDRKIEAKLIHNFAQFCKETPRNLQNGILQPIHRDILGTEAELIEIIYTYCLVTKQIPGSNAVLELFTYALPTVTKRKRKPKAKTKSKQRSRDEEHVPPLPVITRDHIKMCLHTSAGEKLLRSEFCFERFEDCFSASIPYDEWIFRMKKAKKLAKAYLRYSDTFFGVDRKMAQQISFSVYLFCQHMECVFHTDDDERSQFHTFVSMHRIQGLEDFVGSNNKQYRDVQADGEHREKWSFQHSFRHLFEQYNT